MLVFNEKKTKSHLFYFNYIFVYLFFVHVCVCGWAPCGTGRSEGQRKSILTFNHEGLAGEPRSLDLETNAFGFC